MLKGTGTKTRISLTLDKELVEELNDTCKTGFMKISPFVEHLIRKGLKAEAKK
jgi:metal-responsive CopG/Arc/MetJ family transcriptional regulator